MKSLSSKLASQARRLPKFGGKGGRKRLPMLKATPTKSGYQRVTIGTPGKRVYAHRVGRTAGKGTSGKASMFVVDHIDGDKTNNSPKNLQKKVRGDNRASKVAKRKPRA